ncbi:MAG: hypothetical protein WA117_21090, partial [Verrucomicrobiia bacterium]
MRQANSTMIENDAGFRRKSIPQGLSQQGLRQLPDGPRTIGHDLNVFGIHPRVLRENARTARIWKHNQVRHTRVPPHVTVGKTNVASFRLTLRQLVKVPHQTHSAAFGMIAQGMSHFRIERDHDCRTNLFHQPPDAVAKQRDSHQSAKQGTRFSVRVRVIPLNLRIQTGINICATERRLLCHADLKTLLDQNISLMDRGRVE